MKILFVCTHNRCRSILGEAVSNHLAQGRLEAKSAGSQPVGEVHPLSLKYLQEANITIGGLQSESWDVHEAWHPDVVITVCDSAAGEACPLWFGEALRVHWGLTDPSKLAGTESDIAAAFRATIALISQRIEQLLNQDFESLDAQDLKRLFDDIASKLPEKEG